jgi:hypothetical protein
MKDQLIHEFLRARLKRALHNLDWYAQSVLLGLPTLLLHDDLLTLCDDLGEVPRSTEDWRELAQFLQPLGHFYYSPSFALVRFLYHYRRRLCLEERHRLVHDFGNCDRTAIKAMTLLLNRHSDWSIDQCREVLHTLIILAEQRKDYRYLARLIEQRYLPMLDIVMPYLAATPVTKPSEESQRYAFSSYALRNFPGNGFATAEDRDAWFTEFRLRCTRLLPLVWCNISLISTTDWLGLLDGKSIREVLPFRPGKRLVRLLHTTAPVTFPEGVEFWTALVLHDMNCPLDRMRRLREDYLWDRDAPQWWNDDRKRTYLQRIIDWDIRPEAPCYDYLRHSFREGFCLKKRTLASIRRLSREWHDAFRMQQQARLQRRYTLQQQPAISWQRAKIADLLKADVRIIQLTTQAKLIKEGATLGHCVSSYAGLCVRGDCSIHSLRIRVDNKWISRATIEVRQRTIVQARGLRNKNITAAELNWVTEWATATGLEITSWITDQL